MRPALLGIPTDARSSYLRGAAAAPARVRQALGSKAASGWAERLVRVECPDTLEDTGDVDCTEIEAVHERIEQAASAFARISRPFIALGGDHAVTYPILRGLKAGYRAVTVLQIDAHACLHDRYADDPLSHLCVAARVMEEQLAVRLVQAGVRTGSAHEHEQARRFNVEQIDMRAWADGARPSTSGLVYLSIDLDGFDPAFAPGVSHREPGGLTVREVLTVVDTIGGDLIGADIVEFNPSQDIGGLTAGLVAKLIKEIAAQFMTESD
jgi:arginase